MISIAYLLTLFISITPSSAFDCDGSPLKVTIRNNLNGDFSITTDLKKIDKGAFVVIDWKEISLMLPVSFQSGDISFTDKKWLWSYQDLERGLHQNNPRFAQMLPSGELMEHHCQLLDDQVKSS